MSAQQPSLDQLFAAIDALDTDGFLAWLTPDAVFQFGAAPPVHGKNAIGIAVGEFFGTIDGVRHEIKTQVQNGATLACEGFATYTRHDGSTITVPFANFFELDGSLIRGYRIYVDIGPLYASPQ